MEIRRQPRDFLQIILVLIKPWKESFLALLFLVIFYPLSVHAQSLNLTSEQVVPDETALVKKALDQEIYNKPEWLALLHVYKNKPHIKDARFLLSWPRFSLKNEISLNIKAMLNPLDNQVFICKFPARILWLQQQLQLPPISFTHCADFVDYLENAPAKDIKLVYVAENITQPSSMMGHVLLQISGFNKQNKYVDHAVSFYTDVSGFKAPMFMFQATVTGKKGYFSLTPIREKLERYHRDEQRNIWTYDLGLTDEQKQRIQYHVWELKTAPLTYYFKSYNCATLTHFILATTGSAEIEKHFSTALTPLDIAKSVNAAHMITSTTLLPSDSFAIRMLSDRYPRAWQENLKKAIENRSVKALIEQTSSPMDQFVMYEIASHDIDFMRDKGLLKADDQTLDQQLEQSKPLIRDYVIDLTQYKNPLISPNDSQISVGGGYQNHQSEIKLDYLMTAQKLEDDNLQSASERELLLGNIGLKYLTREQRLKIDYLKLYSMSSFIPVDVFTGGISGKLAITYEPRFDTALNEQQFTTIEGGVGLTHQIMPNLSVSALGMLGVDYFDHQLTAHIAPSIGLIANENFEMKSVIQYQRIYQTEKFNRPYNVFKLIQSKRLNSEYSVQFSYENVWNKERNHTSSTLMLKKIF